MVARAVAFNKLKHSQLRRFVWDFKLKHSCRDCGANNPIVLTFDHVRGKKKDNVASLVSRNASLKVVEEEIAKCEVVCANCHSLRTYERSHVAV